MLAAVRQDGAQAELMVAGVQGALHDDHPGARLVGGDAADLLLAVEQDDQAARLGPAGDDRVARGFDPHHIEAGRDRSRGPFGRQCRNLAFGCAGHASRTGLSGLGRPRRLALNGLGALFGCPDHFLDGDVLRSLRGADFRGLGLGRLALRRRALGRLACSRVARLGLALAFRGRGRGFGRGLAPSRLFGGDVALAARPENRGKHNRRKNDDGACQHTALHAWAPPQAAAKLFRGYHPENLSAFSVI